MYIYIERERERGREREREGERERERERLEIRGAAHPCALASRDGRAAWKAEPWINAYYRGLNI